MYQESAPFTPALGLYVDRFWISETLAHSPSPMLILPDGAMDLLFCFSQRRVKTSLCGVMSYAHHVTSHPGDVFFGIRFHPGMASVGLRLNAAPLQDLVAEDDFLKDWQQIGELLPLGKTCFVRLIHEAEKLLCQHLVFDEHQRQRVLSLQNVAPDNVSGLAASLGVSRKKFYRDFKQFYGLSPRLYANVKRLLLFRDFAAATKVPNLSALALQSGFYDQADMTRHIKKMTGQTPLKLLSQLYNTDQ